MANTLYITATRSRSGKSVISLGVMEMLLRRVERVGFFRPVIKSDPRTGDRDNDILLMSEYFKLGAPYEKMYGFTMAEAIDLLSQGKDEELIEGILAKHSALEEYFDFILCEGTDYDTSDSVFDFDLNAVIARNLGSPVLLSASGQDRTPEESLKAIEISTESLCDRRCNVVATIVNRVPEASLEEMNRLLNEREATRNQLTYVIPEELTLGLPSVGEIARAIGATVLYGHSHLNRHVYSCTVAAMQLRNLLTRIEHGTLIVTPGDRADVILACLATASSASFPNISGLVLSGGLMPEEPIIKLIEGFPRTVPIMVAPDDTFPTARAIDNLHSALTPDNDRKITRALALFEKHVNTRELGDKIITTKTTVVTPKMFEYDILQRARAHKQHIVLPEGNEPRILRAAEMLLRREVVDLTLLGDVEEVEKQISALGLRFSGGKLQIVDPRTSDLLDDFTNTYYELRKHKGITTTNAHDAMTDVSYFGTMMVQKGLADAMVSGSVHTTGATIRPAFEIIKTKPGFTIVSSVFFMCLADRVLVYGDCAVNPNPTAAQLAEIAISSAQTAKTFGVEPRVAMLSYSTGASRCG
jgi:phosphate acetyltransferase